MKKTSGLFMLYCKGVQIKIEQNRIQCGSLKIRFKETRFYAPAHKRATNYDL
jgi:hypothetical protein